MASAAVNLLAAGLLTGMSKVIDSIKGKSPEDAAKLAQSAADLDALHAKYASDFQLAKISENVQLNQIAAANIQADDKAGLYSAAARPSIIYVGLFIMTWNFVVMPMLGIHWTNAKPINFPDMFWEIWGIVATGYVFARSADKLFGGSGGTAALPFGIKLDSKGDK